MKNFLQESLEEFRQVVWPTKKETNLYLKYNLMMIVSLAIFLMVLGYVFQHGLQYIRDQVKPASTTSTSDSQSDLATKGDLQDLENLINQKKTRSGSTHSGATLSGSENTPVSETGSSSTEILGGSGSPLQIEVKPSK